MLDRIESTEKRDEEAEKALNQSDSVQKHDGRQTVDGTCREGLPSFIVEATQGWVPLNFRIIWEYRELLYFFAWRDIRARYKQTAIGVSWAVLQPFLIMLVFTIFFGRLVQIPSDKIPYQIFAYTALLPWQLFSGAMSTASNSLVIHQGLVTKVYFPRLIIPFSSVFVGLVDFSIAFVLLLGMMLFYRIIPTAAIVTLPLFILLAMATSLGVGAWLSAINVQYRDVQQAIPFLIQFWLFITPIAYPISIVPDQLRVVYRLNPMVGVIEGFRWALLGQGQAPDISVLISVPVTLLVLLGGLSYFRRAERKFADII